MPQRDWVPAERTTTADGWRYEALTDDRMTVGEVIEYLELAGYIERMPSDDPEGSGYELVGWGSRYFAVPPERVGLL